MNMNTHDMPVIQVMYRAAGPAAATTELPDDAPVV